MVEVGVTGTALPLVTELLTDLVPAVMAPVPPENTAVKLLVPPEEMDVGLALKLVMAGAATTVTVTVPVTEAPDVGVTVRV